MSPAADWLINQLADYGFWLVLAIGALGTLAAWYGTGAAINAISQLQARRNDQPREEDTP